MQCSPSHYKLFRNDGSCFKKPQLLNICEKLNLSNYTHLKKSELWEKINTHMMHIFNCRNSDEHCWLDNLNNSSVSSHVPKQPITWKINDRTWLTNFDLLNVMTQYEKKYRSFKFIGVFPIDFANSNGFGSCISKELCNIKFKSIKNKTQFGIIFNLDKHYQSGSHWVATYINIKPKTTNYGFYYFDSNAMPMPIEIKNLSVAIQNEMKDDTFVIKENTVQKQFKNTECGMFCLHFLIKCLEKYKFNAIINDKKYDDDVHKLRYTLFRI